MGRRPRVPRTILLAGALCVSAARATAPGQSEASRSPRDDRLMALARLDAAIHYFHPVVATRPTPWDSSFAAHALRIAAARDAGAYARAIDALLAPLGDPVTARVPGRRAAWTGVSGTDGVLMVRAADTGAVDAALIEKAGAARAVVVDLRGGAAALPESALARVLLSRPAAAPPQRALQYYGFPRASYGPRGEYRVSWRAIAGASFQGAAVRDMPVAFLVDARSVLPPLALALRGTGRAALVGVGVRTVAVSGATHAVSMGEGVSVAVRIAESPGTVGGVKVDTTVTDDASAVAAARRLAGRAALTPPLLPLDTSQSVARAVPPSHRAWHARYPDAGYRILAATRLWGTIHLFYPYKSFISGSWDAAFREALSAVENARDDLAFSKGIARFASHIGDSHVFVRSGALLREMFSQTPAIVRFIEGKLLVTELLDSTASRAGLRIGDEVITVDGESVERRMARLTPYTAASTPQALRARLASTLLEGPDGSMATLVVRGASGESRTVAVPRRRPELAPADPPRAPDTKDSVFYLLPGNVGYVDLARLPPPMVDSMLRSFASTRAIIFDVRGYPRGTAWAIAPRLAVADGRTVGARFTYLQVRSPDTTQTLAIEKPDLLPGPSWAPKYRGRTFMLMDERTMSQGEHTGLYLEAANNTTFVGSPTSGTNGVMTDVLLPGVISVSFTGMAVRHADGRQLQRVGLLPAVPATPTVAGVRAGRDELLDVAHRHILDAVQTSRVRQ